MNVSITTYPTSATFYPYNLPSGTMRFTYATYRSSDSYCMEYIFDSSGYAQHTVSGLSSSTSYYVNVVAYDANNSYLGESNYNYFTTSSSPTITAVGVVPSNPNPIVGTTVYFTATAYYSTGGSSDITGSATWFGSSNSSSYTTVTGDAGTTKYQYAQIYDPATGGYVQGYCAFTVQSAPSGNGGTVNTITITQITSSSAAASWSATGAYYYQVYLTDNSTNTTIVNGTTTYGTTYSFTGLSSDHSFSLSIIGFNSAGAYVGSNWRMFSTLTSAGGATLQYLTISPANPTIYVNTGGQYFSVTGVYSNGNSMDMTSACTFSSPCSGNHFPGTVAATYSVSATTTYFAASWSISTNITVLTASGASLVSINIIPGDDTVGMTICLGGSQQFLLLGTYSDASQAYLSTDVTWTSSQSITSYGYFTATAVTAANGAFVWAGIGSFGHLHPITVITLSPPSFVSISNQTSSSFTVSYTTVSGATGYYFAIYSDATGWSADKGPQTTPVYTFTGLADGATYQVHCRCVANGANSGWSASTACSTISKRQLDPPIAGACTATATTITVTYTYNDAAATSIAVTVTPDTGSSQTLTVARTGSDATVTVTLGQTSPLISSMHYSVSAYTAGDPATVKQSALVYVTGGITTLVPAPVAAPTMSCSSRSDDGTQLVLSWTSVSGATSYLVTINGNTVDAGNVTTYIVSGRTAGARIPYYVKATNSTGNGPACPTVEYATKPRQPSVVIASFTGGIATVTGTIASGVYDKMTFWRYVKAGTMIEERAYASTGAMYITTTFQTYGSTPVLRTDYYNAQCLVMDGNAPGQTGTNTVFGLLSNNVSLTRPVYFYWTDESGTAPVSGHVWCITKKQWDRLCTNINAMRQYCGLSAASWTATTQNTTKMTAAIYNEVVAAINAMGPTLAMHSTGEKIYAAYFTDSVNGTGIQEQLNAIT